MRSTPLAEARAELSKLVDRALKGEPQRVTRRGREAVVIVSEAEWARGKLDRTKSVPPETVSDPQSFVELLIALGSIEGIDELLNSNENPLRFSRPLGTDFLDEPSDK